MFEIDGNADNFDVDQGDSDSNADLVLLINVDLFDQGIDDGWLVWTVSPDWWRWWWCWPGSPDYLNLLDQGDGDNADLVLPINLILLDQVELWW